MGFGKVSSRRNYGTGVRRWLPALASGVSRFVSTRNALRGRGGISKTKNNRKSHEGGGVTNQFDVKNVYRRRPMPRRRKRVWKKFVKKVNSVIGRDLASQQIIRAQYIYPLTSTNNNVVVWHTSLYPFKGTSGTDDDISAVIAGWTGASAGSALYDNSKFMFGSAVLDVTVANTTSATAIIDVYSIICKNDVDNDLGADLTTQFFNFLNNSFAGNTGGTAISATKPVCSTATTPFQLTEFCSKYTVLSKKKYVLSNGQVFTIQHRDPRNCFIRGNSVRDNYAVRKKFFAYLFFAYGAPNSSYFNPAVTLSCQYTKNYNFKVLSVNYDAVAVL